MTASDDAQRRDIQKRDGHAAAPLADGRYHLLEILGEGGMATVYRGFDVRLQVARAVKVLSPSLAGRRALRERFEAEARTMALFDHANIVRVVDVGIDGERVYIVMDLVTGGSLLERVRDFGPLPPRLALDVMIDTLRALQAAHEHGVVHRDIKPHNILLTDKGQVRVTDFGIARLVEGDEIDDALTRTGAVMGTWGFMAPEQKENAKAVDARADLYSAGATLWSIVTNLTPGHLFAADLDATMMQGIPEALATFIKRGTRYKREDRFASAEEMLNAALLVREQLPLPPADTPALGARAPARPMPAPPSSTFGDGARPLQGRQGSTMVPDMTPVPDEGVRRLSGVASPDIEVDAATWGDAERSVSRSVASASPTSQIRTYVLLGLLAVLVAGAVGLALPSTLEEHTGGTISRAAAPDERPALALSAPAEDPPPVPAADPVLATPTTSGEASAASSASPAVASGSGGRSSRSTSGGTKPESSVRSTKPALTHSPLTQAKMGQTVTIKAKLAGGADYGEVLLNYRASGATVWSNQPMYAQGDALATSLMVSESFAKGFEYFILARSDKAELPALSSGSFKAPYKVSVQ